MQSPARYFWEVSDLVKKGFGEITSSFLKVLALQSALGLMHRM